MGLSVVHGIVKSTGGGIETCSAEGEGTTFDIYIPLIKEQPIEESDKEKEIPRGHECILLIDDEESALKSMESVLKHLGYDVSGKKDPSEALEVFNAESDKFDLVITDQIMPGLSGLELSKKILEVRPDIPVLICTGFSDKIDKQITLNIGIREVVFKPFKMSEFARIVRRILDSRDKMD
jgi:DNA-binding NtrC family response regulator